MQIMEVSLAAVFSLVTQRCVMRGVTRLKRAVRETTIMADNTNMGTSHTERHSVEADQNRLKSNNNGSSSNNENHLNNTIP